MKTWICFLVVLALTAGIMMGCGEAKQADGTETTGTTVPSSSSTQTTQTTQSTATTNGATVVYSYLSDLPQDVQQSIFEAAVDTYQCNERIWEALAPQAHLFGVFDDTYVFLDLYEGSEDMEYMDTVNDLAFRYASSNKLCVYRAGQFYSLPDAYEAGVLSDAHLQQVYEQYYAIYPNMR